MYNKMYNYNIHFIIHENVYCNYTRNKYRHCTLFRTMTIFISLIHKSVFLIIQEAV